MRKIEMIGKKFGMLTVVEETEKDNKGHLMYKCECECGVLKNIHGTHLRAGKTISCGCKNKLKGISSDFWYQIIKGSLRVRTNRNKLLNNITKEYVYELFNEQQGKCKLSGIPIDLPKKWRDRGNFTASLDRIDNSQGYVIGNVQWVHKHVNIMKNTFPQEMFLFLCQEISKNNKFKKYDEHELNSFKWGLNTKHQ